MKTISKFLALLAGVACLMSCNKEDKKPDNGPIDLEQHYEMVYMLGGAPSHWDSLDPLPMNTTDDPDVFEYEIDLIRNTENKLVKFTVNIGEWQVTDYLVPVSVEEGQAYCYLKEGVNELKMCSEKNGNLEDHFFGIAEGQSGTYRLRVNPIKLTLEATKLASLPDKEVIEWVEGTIYMVGDATPAGWDINNPTPMVANGNIHTFEGVLNVGEMKFPTKFAWDSPTYMPTENGTVINKSGIADTSVSLMPEGNPDNKWKVEEKGNYKLTLDTEAMTLNVEWLGDAE